MIALYKYTDNELKALLSSLVVLIDTREQTNEHITTYFDKKQIAYKCMKLDTGDYSVMLPKNIDLGIYRDTYFPMAIERKNSIDELANSIKENRFENELIRAQKMDFVLLVEDSYENLIHARYRSQYNAKALLARIKTFEARYNFNTTFLQDKQLIGNWIYWHLYYRVRTALKG